MFSHIPCPKTLRINTHIYWIQYKHLTAAVIIKNLLDSNSHPDKDLCSVAASSVFWLPTPSLSESSGYCRGPYFSGLLQSYHAPCWGSKDKSTYSLLSRYLHTSPIISHLSLLEKWAKTACPQKCDSTHTDLWFAVRSFAPGMLTLFEVSVLSCCRHAYPLCDLHMNYHWISVTNCRINCCLLVILVKIDVSNRFQLIT